MQIGMVGLGRMGANMTTRLIRGGHEVVAFDVNHEAVKKASEGGATGADSLADLVKKLNGPRRAVWLMVPSGEITESTITDLTELLKPGDVVVDGGNSRYTDSVRRATNLFKKGISFVDSGTSGGVWGLEEGFCLMIGADAEEFERLEPIFATLAPENGYARVGGPGAGHFTKMVHNGIEYALMQSYAEGFEILNASEYDLDLAQIAELWRHGSVVRSWLLDLTARALAEDPKLDKVDDWVDDSGEGRWTLENAVPAPAIAESLFARFRSRQEESLAGKLLASLRNQFGGHAVHEAHPAEDEPHGEG
jgi:6-phosphogluconate dehydrogenase